MVCVLTHWLQHVCLCVPAPCLLISGMPAPICKVLTASQMRLLCGAVSKCWSCVLSPVCRLAPTSEWDTAAADIIVREAGGVVLQAGKVTGKGELLEDWQDVLVKELPLEYNKEDLLNPCFVVFGKRKL